MQLLNFLSNVKIENPDKERNTSCKTKSSESSVPLRKNLTAISNSLPKTAPDIPEKMPEQIKYEPKPIPESLKEGLVEWLEYLHIVKKDISSVHLIPNICRTGVLLCDLINRIEGRTEIIKGIERKPKNRTQALANVNKALEYLRGLSKISSKYLWSGKEIVEGDENVIWGLLEDIKSLFSVPLPVKAKPPPQITKSCPNISLPISVSHENLIHPKPIQREDNKSNRSYSASMKKISSKNTSVCTSRLSRPPSARSIKSQTTRPEKFSITQEMKKVVFDWIDALGIDYEPNTNPYLDILKNGILICELVRIIENTNIKVNLKPRTLQAVHENFDNALTICIAKRAEIPHSLITSPENLIQTPEIIYGLLYYLMCAYSTAVPLDYQPCLLLYGAIGIRNLENIIVLWIESLQILQPPPCIFGELISELKKGTLLCVITTKVTGMKISSIIPEPKTEQTAINNIRKSLEILRKLPKMSQKFTYSEKEIYRGNCNVLLGLLEDILRWVDGLPPRKSGNDGYKDGPYLRT